MATQSTCQNEIKVFTFFKYHSKHFPILDEIPTATCKPSEIVMRKDLKLRAQLYSLGYPRQPSPRATLAEVTFSLFLSKIQPAVYIRIANSSRGARQLGWASCLTSAGRVTLASGTTFLHINALARLTGTSLGVANVT